MSAQPLNKIKHPLIEEGHQEVQCKQVLEEKQHRQNKDYDMEMLGLSATHVSKCKANGDSNSKSKPKKVKVTLTLANYKPGSNVVLVLLGQVDAALNAVQLAEDDSTTPHSKLEKHCEAIDSAAQHQLYSLDIAL
ncbi:hypothetical protein C0995_004305 [Termitomyces sp. Mi166|nr:hypothetical protein C0995_004305 [Termitomyces sp. Mi166\